jgi:hypothetical protein
MTRVEDNRQARRNTPDMQAWIAGYLDVDKGTLTRSGLHECRKAGIDAYSPDAPTLLRDLIWSELGC